MVQLRTIYPVSILLAVVAGLILAFLANYLGILLLPVVLIVVLFFLIVFPWLMQDIFRPFIGLIITWPLLYIYVRLPMPAGIPDISYERGSVLLLLCVVVLQALLWQRRLMKVTTLDILALFYLGVQIFSRLFGLWFGVIGDLDLNGLLDIIIVPLALYWMVKNLLVSKLHLLWLLGGFVIACLPICLTGLYEQAIGVRVFKFSTELAYEWIGRAAGVMLNPAIYGAVLGMGILAGICLLSHIKRKLIQVALVATIAILFYGVFASYTRSAWLSVFGVLFAAQFFIDNLWKKTIPIIILGLLLLVCIWPMLSNSSFFLQRAFTQSTINERFAMLDLGRKLFLEKPFLGWGAGTLNAISLGELFQPSHNIYLTFLVDGGLVLFLSFSAFVGYLLFISIRAYRIFEKGSLERNAVVAMVGGVLIYLLSGFALELRYFDYINALFWICAGVIDFLMMRSRVRRSLS